MKTSIGIIGMGWVGSSTAISILQNGLCNELLISDVRGEVAEGEAMDLNHGMAFIPTAEVRAVSVREMLGCQAIVVTAGRGGRPGESRLDLLSDNIRIAKNISDELNGYGGILIIVANPVDVLTWYYQKFTGMPPGRVIGTGTLLDTARLREIIGDKLNLDPKSVGAEMIAEHGDSSVAVWSKATAGGILLRSWSGWHAEWEDEIAHKVRRAAGEIIKRKGATNHAIGLVTAAILKWILRGDRRIVSVSTCISGPYGIDNVALSLPCIVSGRGIDKILEPELAPDELQGLLRSAEILKAAVASVDGIS